MPESEKKKRGGSRPGAGRKKNLPESARNLNPPRKNLAREIRESLGDPNYKCNCKKTPNGSGTCEKCLWRDEASQPGPQGRPAREYLWNRDDGRPVAEVVHKYEGPIKHELSGPDGDPIPLNIADVDARLAKFFIARRAQ